MSPLAQTLLVCLAINLAIMVLLWLLSLALRNASIVDIYWGVGFVVTSWSAAILNQNDSWRVQVLLVLITIWGFRLALYVVWRNRGHGEDRRYQAMREHHGVRFWWVSLGTVFLLQGVLLWLISMPLQAAAAVTEEITVWRGSDIAGAVLWLVGFAFETIGDWQLARFKSDPANKNRVMDRGLWRYTRHPNYFGDCCLWWGLYLLAAGQGVWWTIGSPIMMTLLLLKVSGVALLESDIRERRPEYAEYQRRTNAFLPGPRKPC